MSLAFQISWDGGKWPVLPWNMGASPVIWSLQSQRTNLHGNMVGDVAQVCEIPLLPLTDTDAAGSVATIHRDMVSWGTQLPLLLFYPPDSGDQ